MKKFNDIKKEVLKLQFNERVELVETLLDDASLAEEQKNVLDCRWAATGIDLEKVTDDLYKFRRIQ